MKRNTCFASVALLLLLAVPSSASAENRFLSKARAAYEALQYGRVLPLLKRAKKIASSDEERVGIRELEAIIHVTFDRPKQARASFDAILDIAPDYQPPADWSPKIIAAYEEAKAARPDAVAQPEPEPDFEPEPDADPKPDGTGGTEVVADPVTEPAVEPGPASGPMDPPPPGVGVNAGSDSPIYTAWWFWTAVGVVVVGGAAATAWALSDPLPERDLGPYRLP